jgi:Flp pilus assembly pilin Flp
MTKTSDDYWDDLGVTWCAIDPNVSVIASRLEVRLRRQSRWITAGLVIGLPLGLAGILLGVASLVIGGISGQWHFVTRGIAIIAMSAILTFALASLLDVRSGSATRAVSEMIDLAVERGQRTLSLIRSGLYACVIAAVFGLVGTAIRTHFGQPPKLSPIVDLVIVGLIALVLFLYGRQVRFELGKYRALKQALALD